MARYEHEAQKIVAYIVIDGRIEIRHDHLLRLTLASELFMLAFHERAAPQLIDCAMFCGCHQPGGGVRWNACVWPLLQGCYGLIVGKLFSDTNVTNDSSEAGNNPG